MICQCAGTAVRPLRFDSLRHVGQPKTSHVIVVQERVVRLRPVRAKPRPEETDFSIEGVRVGNVQRPFRAVKLDIAVGAVLPNVETGDQRDDRTGDELQNRGDVCINIHREGFVHIDLDSRPAVGRTGIDRHNLADRSKEIDQRRDVIRPHVEQRPAPLEVVEGGRRVPGFVPVAEHEGGPGNHFADESVIDQFAAGLMAAAEEAGFNIRGAEIIDPETFAEMDKMVALMEKAGYEVIFPKNMKNLCCGTIWESKGMPDIADRKAKELDDALFEASDGGRYPVLCDQSPCLHRMRNTIKRVKLYEPVEFIYEYLAPHLRFVQTDEPVALHFTCSTRHMNLNDMFVALAGMCTTKVVVPEEVGCCGFAGDKGFTDPEVNRYALRKLRKQLEAAGVKRGFSNSRTCEIGLTVNGGVPYQSIAYLVDECTIKK